MKVYHSRTRKNGRRATSLMVPVAELVSAARKGVEALSEEIGLAVMEMVVDEERSQLADGPERKGHRWGSQPGYVVWGGKKLRFPNKRVQGFNEKAIPLESYKNFQEDNEKALGDMMRGVSTREYEEGVRGFLRGYGIKRSSTSRRFIYATSKKLEELMSRDLSELDITTVFIDGIGFAKNLLVVALGVDSQGRKHTLGLWQGATENATVCRSLLEDLVHRGIDPDKGYLFVLDGGKGLRAGVKQVFGGDAFVQRCHEHKKRNVADHLPKSIQGEFRRKMTAAYGMASYDDAKDALEGIRRELDRLNPSAARSLSEGLEETLTLHKMALPDSLRKSLSTTNLIESVFSFAREKTGRVKRWRGGDQAQRWAATALLRVEPRWRKIKGYTLMPKLLEALGRK